MRKMKNSKGFTLMEMLIVVAIIAILVAIMIPSVTSALEKSRESADAANIRAAYAEVMTAALTGETTNLTTTGAYTVQYKNTEGQYVATIPMTQKQSGWQNTTITNIAGQATSGTDASLADVGSGKTVTVTYDVATNAVTFAVA